MRWNAALGVGGVGTLPERPDDRWGLGAYYLELSDEDLLEGLRVGDEAGGELYYTVAVTSAGAAPVRARASASFMKR